MKGRSMQSDKRKVGIVGLGAVGVTSAYAILLNSLVDELVLVSRTKDKAIGEKLDLEHGLPFLGPATIVATDDYAELAGADIVVITAGVAQEPGQSRLELLQKNVEIIKDITPKIVAAAPESVIIVVSNPVDVLTYVASQVANLPYGRVFGSGTMLDTARFRFHLSELLHVHPQSIHAYIMGEHGDSSFPVLSSASIGGQALRTFPNYSDEKAHQVFEEVKHAAYEIIQAKGATYYAIGVIVMQLVKTVLSNKRSVLPVSIPITDYNGQSEVAVSVPCIVGREGVVQVLQQSLSEVEQGAFAHSCQILREARAGLTVK